MDSLTLFGLFAVTAMMLCYALKNRSHWFVPANLWVPARRVAVWHC